jgi:hypothetical protein
MQKPVATAGGFTCRCGQPVFFRNSRCLACGRDLGYEPHRRRVIALEPADLNAPDNGSTLWREAGVVRGSRWRRCVNLLTPSGCNWLISEDSLRDPRGSPVRGQCAACRLTRTLPALSLPENVVWWQRFADAQRQLVATLIALQLPVQSWHDDPQQGLGFDLLRSSPGGLPVVTGHAQGIITIDIEEADDATRERRRQSLHEPYRTLLGHLRHESGHYYWMRLVQHDAARLEAFRTRFGDERADYTAALRAYYQRGAPADWALRFVSAYASAHPWEDWAETWAHFLHLVDTVDTARRFGLNGERVELSYERFDAAQLADGHEAEAVSFAALLGEWMELTGVLNELSRSMGLPDFYPFVLSLEAARKLFFVHRLVQSAGMARAAEAARTPLQETAR